MKLSGVITAPDKPSGRGQKIQSTAVKLEAEKLGDPIAAKKSKRCWLSRGYAISKQIFKSSLLFVCYQNRFGICLHTDRLIFMPPSARLTRCCSIHWAIINGYNKSGLTTFQLQHAIDTGPILKQETVDIGENMTTGELYNAMRHMGGKMVLDSLAMIGSGTKQIPQNPTGNELPLQRFTRKTPHSMESEQFRRT